MASKFLVKPKKSLLLKTGVTYILSPLVPVKLIPIRPAGDHLPLWTHWVAVLEPEAAQRDDDELDGMILDGGDNVDATNSGPKRWRQRNTGPIPCFSLSWPLSSTRTTLFSSLSLQLSTKQITTRSSSGTAALLKRRSVSISLYSSVFFKFLVWIVAIDCMSISLLRSNL